MAITHINRLRIDNSADPPLTATALYVNGILHVSGTTYFGGAQTQVSTQAFSDDVTFSATVTFTGSSKKVKVKGPLETYDTVLLTGSGKSVKIKGPLTCYSTVVATSTNQFTMKSPMLVTGGGYVKMRSNGTSALAGVRTITTAGSGIVSVGRLATTSQIIFTPAVNTAINNIVCYERYSARVTGAAGSFRVKMHQVTGTAVTGRVFWTILNPAR